MPLVAWWGGTILPRDCTHVGNDDTYGTSLTPDDSATAGRTGWWFLYLAGVPLSLRLFSGGNGEGNKTMYQATMACCMLLLVVDLHMSYTW